MRFVQLVMVAILLLGLSACASGPRYDTHNVNTRLTAVQVAAAPNAYTGTQVIWGGVIIATRNQAGYSEMEILSYPLTSAQRPETGQGDQGRFLARYPGYLEAVDYAPGRRITLRGKIERVVAGKVGEAPYTFPLVQAEHLYLWPIDTTTAPSSPTFHFGVGVIFGH